MTNTYVRLRYVTRVLAPRGSGIPGPIRTRSETFPILDSLTGTLTAKDTGTETLAVTTAGSQDFKARQTAEGTFATDSEETGKFT